MTILIFKRFGFRYLRNVLNSEGDYHSCTCLLWIVWNSLLCFKQLLLNASSFADRQCDLTLFFTALVFVIVVEFVFLEPVSCLLNLYVARSFFFLNWYIFICLSTLLIFYSFFFVILVTDDNWRVMLWDFLPLSRNDLRNNQVT